MPLKVTGREVLFESIIFRAKHEIVRYFEAYISRVCKYHAKYLQYCNLETSKCLPLRLNGHGNCRTREWKPESLCQSATTAGKLHTFQEASELEPRCEIC